MDEIHAATLTALERSPTPLTIRDIQRAVGCSKSVANNAITHLTYLDKRLYEPTRGTVGLLGIHDR
jgi:DNA-binding IclR family transcriptional regulator